MQKKMFLTIFVNYVGLLRHYNKLDPMNCNVNDENCNSATMSGKASTKQGNSVTKSQVGVISLEPNNGSSVPLRQQCKVNETKIADTSLIHSIKRRFKNISSIKSHSTTNNRCKRASRRVLYRCCQKEKNVEEQIVAKSELHSELLQDYRVDLTRMDINSTEEILNVANYAVMKGMETQVKNSSHLKCDMNIKSNNTAATEADADLHSVIDRSLHQKHSNTSALNNSSTFTNVSLQNSNNLSVQVKNQELRNGSQFLNTVGKKPYKSVLSDSACSRISNLIKSMRNHTGEKPYKCDQCGYAFSRKGSLIIHKRTHTGERPYKCNDCNYASIQKSGLNKHLRTHTGEKKYKCNVCKYASFHKSDLNKHLRIHTGEKTYKCNDCNYASYRKSHVNVHLMTHTGEKPHKCNVCNYRFSQKSNLIIHTRKHTGEKPYKCNVCNYAFSHKHVLGNHLRTHTGERPYKCNVCNYAFSHKSNLIVHNMRKHSEKKPI